MFPAGEITSQSRVEECRHMVLLVRAVAQLEILAREARAIGDQGSHETLITAQNVVLHRMLAKLPTNGQRPKLKIVG